MLRVVVLGAAAGGGVPQWNCGCEVCRKARGEHPELQKHAGLDRGQRRRRALVPGQRLPRPAPAADRDAAASSETRRLRHSPIAGVILTNGEIDAVAGLLSMREGSPFAIYAHEKVLAILRDNSIFNVLSEKNVKRVAIAIDRAFEPALPDGKPSGLEILPFTVPGKGAWYLEGKAHPGGSDGAGDTLGLRIRDKASGKYFYFIAACADVTDELKSRLAGAPLLFFDGTVWRDDETGRGRPGNQDRQGHGPYLDVRGDAGAIESLAGLDIDRKIFLHINNSNPALLQGSAERKIAEGAGWQIGADGTEIVL